MPALKNVEAADSRIHYLTSGRLTQFLMRGIFATRNYAISLPRHPPGPLSITQPSDATDTAFSTRFKDSANTPPAHCPADSPVRQLNVTTLPPPISFRLNTSSAIYDVSTQLKATFHLGLEPTLTDTFWPSDQRANHSATLTPRKFRLPELKDCV